MKILFLLVQAPTFYKLFEEIGIECITSYLRERHHKVSLMSEYVQDIDYQAITELNPDVIGLPHYITNEELVYIVCTKLKALLPNVKIVLGGYTATSLGSKIFERCNSVDFISCGEGELVMENLLKALEGKISLKDVKGIMYRTEQGIVSNEPQPLMQDISSLPWPARDLLVQKKYKIALLSTSRGCSSNCTFCVTRKYWKCWRGRPIRDVVDEIEYIINTYNIHVFYFIDCSFENPNISYDRLETFAKEIIKRNITIYYLAFFRPDFARHVKPELVELLYQSGLMGALIGIESNDEESLKIYNKKTSSLDNTMVIDLFRSHNIHVDIGFIMFHPFSQFAGLHKNINFLKEQGFACIINFVVSPYIMSKDCALFHKIKKHGLMVDEEQLYGYHYADPRIEVLVKYLESFFKKKHSPQNAEVFSMHRSLTTLAYWKRIYKHDERLTAVFQNTEEKYITEKDKLNFNIAAWFRNLLYLAEQEWNEEKANIITEKYLSDSFLQIISEKITYARYLLNLQISRLGIDLHALPFVEQM